MAAKTPKLAPKSTAGKSSSEKDTGFAYTREQFQQLIEDTLAIAKKLGATDSAAEVSEGAGLSVSVRKGKLEILDKIYFETDKDEIKSISFPLLDAIASTIKGNPEIQLIEIQGHADDIDSVSVANPSGTSIKYRNFDLLQVRYRYIKAEFIHYTPLAWRA